MTVGGRERRRGGEGERERAGDGDAPLSDVCSSPDLVEWKRRNSASLVRFCESSWMPSLRFLPNAS